MTRLANPELPVRILDEAERIVVTSGHQSINMRELARRVGVTATAIYHVTRRRLEIMILVLKGSPKEEQSVTRHYMQYLACRYPEHEFLLRHVARRRCA